MRVEGFEYGANLVIRGRLYLKSGSRSHVTIGDNCHFNSGMGVNPLGRNIKGSVRAEDGAVLKIGNNCGFSSACIWAHESIVIGNNVNVGADTLIFDSDAHSLSYEDRRCIDVDMQNKASSPIIIEDDVLIGARCIILKGVRIGARSIVGSGSVVVSDVPSDSIYAGNPARLIRSIS